MKPNNRQILSHLAANNPASPSQQRLAHIMAQSNTQDPSNSSQAVINTMMQPTLSPYKKSQILAPLGQSASYQIGAKTNSQIISSNAYHNPNIPTSFAGFGKSKHTEQEQQADQPEELIINQSHFEK